MRAARIIGLAGLLLFVRGSVGGQTAASPQFEVASVRPIPPLPPGASVPPGFFIVPRADDPQRFRARYEVTGPLGILEWRTECGNSRFWEPPSGSSENLLTLMRGLNIRPP